MALRDKLRERAAPYLEPGEQIQQIFLSQSGPNPNWMFLTYLVFFWVHYHVFVVTDRNIVILESSFWAPTKPKALEKRLPRNASLGQPSGLWGNFEIEGTKYYVHKRFHKDVTAASSGVPASVVTPSAP